MCFWSPVKGYAHHMCCVIEWQTHWFSNDWSATLPTIRSQVPAAHSSYKRIGDALLFKAYFIHSMASRIVRHLYFPPIILFCLQFNRTTNLYFIRLCHVCQISPANKEDHG
jgi:hypothetical protein